ncbi:MAG: IMP dehydrogenase [Candidatus Parvarchaeota archaeon]|nr:IMP dehydrogenase [Candidatus Parvarchaeota archaeon]MCW1301785.1 IMP dehydrogenase [Candidatus Parvarchaeota archaeon]
MKIINDAITFDDVLLVPKVSRVLSRGDVSTDTNLTEKIRLHIPILSANMDTVTESAMAIAMAKLGGAGVIHRFNSIEAEAEEVDKVKRELSFVISSPYTITEDATLRDLLELAAKKGVSGFPVVKDRKLVGIISKRDYEFEKDLDKKVKEMMSKDVISSKAGIGLDDAEKILSKNKIEKLPIVDKDNNLVGMITSKDIKLSREYKYASKDKRGRLIVGGSVGISGDYMQRAKMLVEADVDFIVVDVANGYLSRAADVTKELKDKFGIDIIAGNIATKEGALNLKKAGADAIKVGIGPGGACLTRTVAGVGYPQLSAIIDVAGAGARIIADGGIRKSADLSKALAAGADAVMVGSILAGTDETPGVTVTRNGENYKFYRGMASINAFYDRGERMGLETEIGEYTPEGTETLVQYKGSVVKIIYNLVGGLRSAMTYLNARNLAELRKNASFVRLTAAGRLESKYQ